MRVVIFLTCMCYLLLGGYNYIHIGDQQMASRYSISQPIEDTHQQKFTTIKHDHSGSQDEYVISDRVEDEDPDSLFARKFRLLVAFYLALASLFAATGLYIRFKAFRPYHALLSYKYLTQRVLRI